MEIILERFAKKANYTIGRLYIRLDEYVKVVVDGELITKDKRYFCDTLEQTYRDLKKGKKVPGRTAIPCGRYQILITKSLCYGCWLPVLLNVPGFKRVRIYAGNYPEETTKSILIGYNKRPGMLIKSRATMHNLMYEMTEALNRKEQIWITITNNFKK